MRKFIHYHNQSQAHLAVKYDLIKRSNHMIRDPKNHNTDILISTQLQFLILLFFNEEKNFNRKDININEIVDYISNNKELWISQQDDQSDREKLEKSFQKRVQDNLFQMKSFKLEAKNTDGRIVNIEEIEPIERDPDCYKWQRGKDFDRFLVYILSKLGEQFDIEIGIYSGEDTIDPYSNRCILTTENQLKILELYRKHGLTP